MSKDDYRCTREGCPSRFTTTEARDKHSQQEHKPCPHLCGQSFAVTGLGRHAKGCINNPNRHGKLHCSHPGCTASFVETATDWLIAHERLPHVACICGAEFSVKSIKKHQVRCSRWLAEQAIKRASNDTLHTQVCAACEDPLVAGEGMHVQIGAPLVDAIVLHGPQCFVQWAQRDETVTGVFGVDWLTHMRHFQVRQKGCEHWVTADEAARLLDHGNGTSLSNMVREPDGLVRPITDADIQYLRRHMTDISGQVA